MTIELTPEHQRIIERVMHSGAYPDAEHVISAALEALAEDVDEAATKARKIEPRQTGQSLIDACAKVRGLLTDEEVDTLFARNRSYSRPVDFE